MPCGYLQGSQGDICMHALPRKFGLRVRISLRCTLSLRGGVHLRRKRCLCDVRVRNVQVCNRNGELLAVRGGDVLW